MEEVGEEGLRKVVKVTGIKNMGKTLTCLLKEVTDCFSQSQVDLFMMHIVWFDLC